MTALPPGWLADQLPEVMGRESFVRRFLSIFEVIADSLLERLDGLEHYIDVGLAPAEHVRWMGTWLARPVDTALPEDRQRKVVATAGQELPRRGTARWLRALLEAYTGGSVEIADTGGVYLPGRWEPQAKIVLVRLERTGSLNRDQLEQLIQRELPVDARLSLHLPPNDAEALTPSMPPDNDTSEPPTPHRGDGQGERDPTTAASGRPVDEEEGWMPTATGSYEDD